MPVITPQKLIDLQRSSPDNIRNICILAHVDHGKTSLTDTLLATNGIISPKLAGKIRYLDSRPDEQLRGITMEASAISLYFSMLRRRAADDASAEVHEYLINLIDSPGHVDFQSEVSTASRLCDGAVVLVDAVEGVCSQTVTVLRQTWVEKLKPILVINKMDRLITELQMSPAEAYVHLAQLLEMVNAVMGTFFQGERMEDDLRWRERMEERVQAAKSQAVETEEVVERDYEEKDDEDIYFAPEKNNVVFSSAIDGWAFTVKQFAGIYDKKLGIKREILEKVLWGDFYLDPKTKRVLGSKHLKGRPLKPMFVQLVLENIWAVYNATVGGSKSRGDEALLTKITSSLNITIAKHILNSRDPHNILTTLFSKWLPLSTALLVSVIEQLPSPRAAQESRMPALLESTPSYPDIDPNIKDAICKFTQDKDKPLVAFVSKMIAVKESELPRNKNHTGQTLTAEEARELARKKRAEILRAKEAEQNGEVPHLTSVMSSIDIANDVKPIQTEEEDPERFIGFARIYSGTLSVGDDIYVIPPKYSPSHPQTPPALPVKVEALYLLMGRALESLESVPAGTIFGIEGLESALLKQGTLSSYSLGAPNLAGIGDAKVEPIVRVSLEPENPSDLDKMINGLKMLERADPCATYEVLESGEHVLGTAGELHLERCLKDLRERFARCEIQAGRPIVPYREGIVNHPSVSGGMEVGPRGTVTVDVFKGAIKATLRVRPLPRCVIDYLTGNSSALKKAVEERLAENHHEDHDEQGAIGEMETGRAMSAAEFATGLRQAFSKSKEKEGWAGVVDKIIAFGPRRVGPNLLIDGTGQLGRPFFSSTHASNGDSSPTKFSDKIIYAFQLAASQGPLCHEPVQGIAVTVESLTIPADPSPPSDPAADETTSSSDQQSRLTSEAIKATRLAIHRGLLEWSPRLWEAVYACSTTASADALGRAYAVLTRRGAAILSEDLAEGNPTLSNSYVIESLLPLREALGFADELRKGTSGEAQASLAFRGFEVMVDEDPFWVPKTEEEREDLGDTADRENRAKGLVDGIRERKGLLVLGKGLDPEKQRTMKR